MASKLLLTLAVAGAATIAQPAFAQFASDFDRREALRHYREGQELMSAERYEQAAAAFRRAVENDRLLTLAHHGLGEAYMALRRYASAIQAFLGARSAFETLHRLSERNRQEVERWRDDEIRELREVIRRTSSPLRRTQLDARVQELQRQRKSNDEAFVSPAELSLALGSAYFRNNRLEDAEREWQNAVGANPGLGEAHNNLAALYAMTGRRPEAERAVEAAEKARFRVDPRLKEDIQRLK